MTRYLTFLSAAILLAACDAGESVAPRSEPVIVLRNDLVFAFTVEEIVTTQYGTLHEFHGEIAPGAQMSIVFPSYYRDLDDVKLWYWITPPADVDDLANSTGVWRDPTVQRWAGGAYDLIALIGASNAPVLQAIGSRGAFFSPRLASAFADTISVSIVQEWGERCLGHQWGVSEPGTRWPYQDLAAATTFRAHRGVGCQGAYREWGRALLSGADPLSGSIDLRLEQLP